jgi:hypothetical protein
MGTILLRVLRYAARALALLLALLLETEDSSVVDRDSSESGPSCASNLSEPLAEKLTPPTVVAGRKAGSFSEESRKVARVADVVCDRDHAFSRFA